MTNTQRRRSRTRDASLVHQVDAVRVELQSKCCFIRLQYHPVSRVAFEVVWRSMFITDLFTDISLCLQFSPFSTLWWLFVAAFSLPYILSSIVLFLPFHRRLLSSSSPSNHWWSGPWTLALVILAYSVVSLPCIVLLDLYICSRLLTTDLATTRYLLYYWRLKTLVEQTLESIPQTVLLILIGSGVAEHSSAERIDVRLLFGSLSISICCLLWYCMVIYYGSQGTGLSVVQYLWKYYIMQGMDMIPYQEAITQNLLSDFVLTTERLTTTEWKQLTSDIFLNFSIVRFDVARQFYLEADLWCKLFEGLATNNLTTLRLRECFIFHPENLVSRPKQLQRQSTKFKMVEATASRMAPQSNSKNVQRQSTALDLSNLLPLKASFQALLLNVPSLVVVDLGGNCLCSVFRELIKPMSKLKKLRELYLSKNQLQQIGLTENEYVQLFRGCVSLAVLDLSDNFFDDDNVDVICGAIRKCRAKKQLRALHSINLDENEISIDGATKLLSIVDEFGKLSLNLHHNLIDEELFEDMLLQNAVQVLIDDSDDE